MEGHTVEQDGQSYAQVLWTAALESGPFITYPNSFSSVAWNSLLMRVIFAK